MAVGVLDTGTPTYQTAATTHNYTYTISSGATLAVFFVVQDATKAITSVTWDQGGTNQACTLIGSQTNGTNGAVYLYGLLNPTVGASKTLAVVQVSGATSSCMQTYTGTVTSSVAAAATNVLVANGATATAGTAAQSGANGDMYISLYTANGTLSNSQRHPDLCAFASRK